MNSEHSTVGIDIGETQELNLDPSIQFTIFDFAGQLEYCTVHQVRIYFFK